MRQHLFATSIPSLKSSRFASTFCKSLGSGACFHSNLDNGRACAFLYLLLCDMLGNCFHSTNQCRKVFPAPSFQKQLPCDMTMLVSPLLLCSASQQSQSWLKPDTFLQLFIFVLLLPTSSSSMISPVSRASSLHLAGKRISCPPKPRLPSWKVLLQLPDCSLR